MDQLCKLTTAVAVAASTSSKSRSGGSRVEYSEDRISTALVRRGGGRPCTAVDASPTHSHAAAVFLSPAYRVLFCSGDDGQ